MFQECSNRSTISEAVMDVVGCLTGAQNWTWSSARTVSIFNLMVLQPHVWDSRMLDCTSLRSSCKWTSVENFISVHDHILIDLFLVRLRVLKKTSLWFYLLNLMLGRVGSRLRNSSGYCTTMIVWIQIFQIQVTIAGYGTLSLLLWGVTVEMGGTKCSKFSKRPCLKK